MASDHFPVYDLPCLSVDPNSSAQLTALDDRRVAREMRQAATDVVRAFSGTHGDQLPLPASINQEFPELAAIDRLGASWVVFSMQLNDASSPL